MMAPSNFTCIPVIDLSNAGKKETKPELLEDLRYALTDVGFLYVSNHSVPNTVTKDLINALPRLFDLGEEEKRYVALENSPHFLGYSGTGAETTAGRADKREQFEFATELKNDWKEGDPLADRLKGPNQVSWIPAF